MISGAGLALILTFIYGSVLDSSLAEQVTAMTQQDAAFAAELEASGMTLDALIEGMQGTLSILLGLGAALNVVKIVVGGAGHPQGGPARNVLCGLGRGVPAAGRAGNDVQRRGVRVWFVRSGGGRVRPGVLPLGRHPEQARFPADAERRTGGRGTGGRIRFGLAAGAQVKKQQEPEGAVNSTPFVRQYGILNNKWGVLLCQKGYQTNAIHQNSRSRL